MTVQVGVTANPDGLVFDVPAILRSRGIEPTPTAVEAAARMLAYCCGELEIPVEEVCTDVAF